MTQPDLNEPVAAELGRLTLRAVTAETMLAHARTRIAELEAEREQESAAEPADDANETTQ